MKQPESNSRGKKGVVQKENQFTVRRNLDGDLISSALELREVNGFVLHQTETEHVLQEVHDPVFQKMDDTVLQEVNDHVLEQMDGSCLELALVEEADNDDLFGNFDVHFHMATASNTKVYHESNVLERQEPQQDPYATQNKELNCPTLSLSLSFLLASWRLESKIAILTSLRSLLSLMGGMTSLTVTTVLHTNDLVRGFHLAKDRARMSVKLDLSKAFDCVQWDFLEAAMLHLNLPPQIVSLIMECVTNPSFSITINGSPCGFFNSTRGLRQGCPLSP